MADCGSGGAILRSDRMFFSLAVLLHDRNCLLQPVTVESQGRLPIRDSSFEVINLHQLAHLVEHFLDTRNIWPYQLFTAGGPSNLSGTLLIRAHRAFQMLVF